MDFLIIIKPAANLRPLIISFIQLTNHSSYRFKKHQVLVRFRSIYTHVLLDLFVCVFILTVYRKVRLAINIFTFRKHLSWQTENSDSAFQKT